MLLMKQKSDDSSLDCVLYTNDALQGVFDQTTFCKLESVFF